MSVRMEQSTSLPIDHRWDSLRHVVEVKEFAHGELVPSDVASAFQAGPICSIGGVSAKGAVTPSQEKKNKSKHDHSLGGFSVNDQSRPSRSKSAPDKTANAPEWPALTSFRESPASPVIEWLDQPEASSSSWLVRCLWSLSDLAEGVHAYITCQPDVSDLQAAAETLIRHETPVEKRREDALIEHVKKQSLPTGVRTPMFAKADALIEARRLEMIESRAILRLWQTSIAPTIQLSTTLIAPVRAVQAAAQMMLQGCMTLPESAMTVMANHVAMLSGASSSSAPQGDDAMVAHDPILSAVMRLAVYGGAEMTHMTLLNPMLASGTHVLSAHQSAALFLHIIPLLMRVDDETWLSFKRHLYEVITRQKGELLADVRPVPLVAKGVNPRLHSAIFVFRS